MSKGGGSSTTVQKSEPWSGLQPYLTDAYKQAQQLYQSGGPDYFPNATYVPFSDQTQLGLDLLQNRALGSPLEFAAQNYAQNALQSGGVNTDTALGSLNAIAGGQYNAQDISRDQLGNVRNVTAAQSNMQFNPSQVNAQSVGGVSGIGQVPAGALRDTASGEYLNANPYLDQMYNTAAGKVTEQFNQNVMPGLNATFGAAGRTGGGAHALAAGEAAGELGESLSGLASNVYGNNYQAERDRQLGAANNLGGFQMQTQGLNLDNRQNNAGMNLQGQLANQSAGLQGMQMGLNQSLANQDAQMQSRLANQGMDWNQQNLMMNMLGMNQQNAMNNANLMGNASNNILGYSNQMMGNQNQLAALTPALAGMDYNNIQQMLNAGGMIENKSGQVLQDQMDRFNFYQNRPEQNMNNYVSWLNGIPGSQFGSQSTSGGGGGSTFGNVLGGGMMGAGLAGALPTSMLSAIPGGGWALAGLGALGGLLG